MGRVISEMEAKLIYEAYTGVAGYTKVFATEDGKTEIYVRMNHKDGFGVLCPAVAQLEHVEGGKVKKTAYEWTSLFWSTKRDEMDRVREYAWARTKVWPSGKGGYDYHGPLFISMTEELESDELIPEMKKIIKEAML